MSLKIRTYRNQQCWQYDFTHQKKRYRGWISPVSMMTEKDAQNIYDLKVHETIAMGIKSPVHILPVQKEKPISKKEITAIVNMEIQTALKQYSAGLSHDDAQSMSSLFNLGVKAGMKLSRIIDSFGAVK